MKKIGIVGHMDNIHRIQQVIEKKFPDIEGYPIETRDVSHIQTTIDFLTEHERDFEGIIFTGKILYDIMNHNMHSQNPWVYIENDETQLQKCLLAAHLKHHLDIRAVSIDSYSEEFVWHLYEALGLSPNEITPKVADCDLFSDTLIEDLVLFHKKNILSLQSTFALTTVSSVHKRLLEEGLPALLLTPHERAIETKLHTLLEKIKFQDMAVSQIVVISIEIDTSGEYDWTSENEYSLMLQKTKITEEVYRFAQRIQAAVVETERHYLLFTTKQIVEFETQNLRQLSILSTIQKKTSGTVSVGIGFGITAREAKANAVVGKNKALKMGGNQCFVVYSRKHAQRISPLEQDLKPSSLPVDSTFKEIAEKSGLSINNIYQLKCLMDMYKKDTFTSHELASELGNSLRSMNRILEKLEAAGYVEVVGKKILGKSGRPSRILKLLICTKRVSTSS